MPSVLDQVGSFMPKFNMASVGQFAYFGILALLFVVILGGFFALWAWWYITKKKFNKKIRIFKKVDGRYKPSVNDTAMERKIGTGGDTIFYFKKLKKIVPRGSIQTGENTYWYAEREDGELINIGMEDIDLKMREANIYYNESEQRYARASLQKLNKDRFLKENFWQKYGRDIMTVIFIVIITVMLLLIVSRLVELVGRIDGIMKSSKDVIDAAGQILGKLDNVCSQSSLVPVK